MPINTGSHHVIIICYILTKAFLSIETDRAFSSSCNLCDNTVFVTSEAMADACSICAISSPVGTNNAGLSNTSFILEISYNNKTPVNCLVCLDLTGLILLHQVLIFT